MKRKETGIIIGTNGLNTFAFIYAIRYAKKNFSARKKRIFTDTLNYFKYCGEYAKFIIDNDDLPDDYPVDLDRIAYIDDNLYDIIADAVGRMHYEYKCEIPYTINPDMYR